MIRSNPIRKKELIVDWLLLIGISKHKDVDKSKLVKADFVEIVKRAISS